MITKEGVAKLSGAMLTPPCFFSSSHAILISSTLSRPHTDFGASKLNHHDDRGNSNVQSMAGTVYWMAPEVIKGDAYGRLIDTATDFN